MRKNPLGSIYEACNTGNSHQKWENLPDFPRLLDVELTNLCNFRCLMCPTGNQSQQRHKGFMPDEVFAKILDDIGDRRVALRFIRWGEPLMHPKIIEFLTEAKRRGHLVHLNTNGSHLTEEMADRLLAVPIDSIKFSFQGVDRQSYHEMRNIDFFDGLFNAVTMLVKKRADSPIPFIQLSTTVTYESQEQIDAFTAHAETLGDLVNVGHTSFDWLDLKAVRLRPHEIEMLQKLKEHESLEKVHPECPEVFDKLSVNWDGKVSACCMDSDDLMILGDVTTMSLAEIWRCEAMEGYRALLADMRHDDISLCRNCWDTHKLFKPAGGED